MTLAWLIVALALGAPQDAADLQTQAKALSAATDAALAKGDYETAIAKARAAFALHEQLGAPADAAWDLNAIGLANQYLTRYPDALAAYRRALDLHRAAGTGDGEISQLNNIGGIHFLQGRYSDALSFYQLALRALPSATPKERGRLRKLTLSNLAAIDQRLGADERALDVYAQLSSDQNMLPSEEAQVLVNRGALMRRLGDPMKALDLYRAAQQLFARAAHRDGEIGAWRNIGIAYALDLGDYDRAREAFDRALGLAESSSHQRGLTQALIYRGEVLRRLGEDGAALDDLERALDAATATGLVEEQWKALYSIGRVREAAGDTSGARDAFERAVTTIESVRSDVRSVALRSEFLADKRDVYDALIWLRGRERPAPAADLFRLIEQSRARTWQDRLQPNAAPASLRAVQATLADDTLLLEYSISDAGIVLVSVTRRDATVVMRPARPEDARAIQRFTTAVQARGTDWRSPSADVGSILLGTVPLTAVQHLLVVSDGGLQFVPFEALILPASNTLAIERFDVSYLPSAAYLLRPRDPHRASWTWPWQRTLVAFADPTPASSYPLETRALPPLLHAREEAQRVAHEVGGRADLHLGDGARKGVVLDGRLRTAPFVLFSTHAVADTRDPDRSRILLAPATAQASADYLFLREVLDLDLSGVRLVALSACSTERGKVIRGEGVEGFSRALLAAGAAAAVTTLWDVADRPAAEFMTQFAYALGRGVPAAAALRRAKVQFLQSGQAWAHPYDWAGYILTGDGGETLPRAIPWIVVVLAALVLVLLATAAIRAAATASRSRSLRRTPY
jgi:CHAT domain-containing protein